MRVESILTDVARMKYRFVRHIADGGMGTVDLAVRSEGSFRRAYAIKRLRPAYRDDAAVRRMFTQEAQIAGLLHHPNVVSVIDLGEDADGPFLVMDFVEGLSLSALLSWTREADQLLPIQLVLRVMIQVSLGLHAAHELVSHGGEKLRLVHRDVSPQNILVGFDGVARLTDFGIAKAALEHDKTSTGLLKGKVGYLSPEQLRFQPATRQSDLFAFGVVLFEALTSSRLYARDDAQATALAILEEPPPDLFDLRDDVHPALIELVFQLLSKDPAGRPTTAAAVTRTLETILAEQLVGEEPMLIADFMQEHFAAERLGQEAELTEVTRASRRGRRKAWALGTGATLFAATALGVAFAVNGILSGGGEGEAPPRNEPLTPAEEAETTPTALAPVAPAPTPSEARAVRAPEGQTTEPATAPAPETDAPARAQRRWRAISTHREHPTRAREAVAHGDELMDDWER